MNEAGEQASTNNVGSSQPDRKYPARPHGSPGGNRGSSTAKPPQEPRRKRGGDQRFAGWGDQLLRSICARAIHELPSTFPVEHHQGTATIPRAVVAQRDDELLFCTFSHCGPHAWPDGEEVSDVQTEPDR